MCTARVENSLLARTGDQLALEFDMSKAHYFDSTSDYLTLRQLIDEDQLGEITYYEARFRKHQHSRVTGLRNTVGSG